MANVKITGLTELTTLSTDDLIEVVDDPAGTPVSRKMKHINVVKAGMGLTATSQTFEVREVLHDETLASAGSFDVSSLSQSYDHLELILVARGDVTATADQVRIFFNNDTTETNYRSVYVLGNGSSASTAAADTAYIGQITGASSPANYFALVRLFIPFYTDTNFEGIVDWEVSLRNNATVQSSWKGSTFWESTSAINRIMIRTDNDPTDQFVTGSRLQIVGVGPSS